MQNKYSKTRIPSAKTTPGQIIYAVFCWLSEKQMEGSKTETITLTAFYCKGCKTFLYYFLSSGGVTLLRAAAKNHARVTVICDPADYDR